MVQGYYMCWEVSNLIKQIFNVSSPLDNLACLMYSDLVEHYLSSVTGYGRVDDLKDKHLKWFLWVSWWVSWTHITETIWILDNYPLLIFLKRNEIHVWLPDNFSWYFTVESCSLKVNPDKIARHANLWCSFWMLFWRQDPRMPAGCCVNHFNAILRFRFVHYARWKKLTTKNKR